MTLGRFLVDLVEVGYWEEELEVGSCFEVVD